MTDEELGQKIVWGNSMIDNERNVSWDYASIGERARTLLAARPEVTREAVREWYWNGEGKTLPFPSNENAMTTLVLAALSHFAPPPAPLPPICGMSVEEIEEAMHDDKAPEWKDDTLGALQVCARVAHRLAQPAPVVDPDAAAKAAQRAYTADFFPDDEHLRPTWERISEQERNGWRRAVTAVKERGE